mmetsp:Transcript_73850/g.130239  ORF Transcript_73850/g.130239 Transcript_73850/m.130239 type:complete len:96 (+) Transcript_73850:50-337(+)
MPGRGSPSLCTADLDPLFLPIPECCETTPRGWSVLLAAKPRALVRRPLSTNPNGMHIDPLLPSAFPVCKVAAHEEHCPALCAAWRMTETSGLSHG